MIKWNYKMQIREATVNDIPQIVSVLRSSLGESKLPKSEEIWRYKHIENPFGQSLVLVAEEDGMIIGVRAFMRWKWQLGKKIFSSFRAVDTATHPDHQGKGIFKKLTLRAVEIGEKNGDHFIFNTPNSQSMPGYLKMGWKKVNKLEVQLIPVSPFFWKFTKEKPHYEINKKISERTIEDLTKNSNAAKTEKNRIFTPKNQTYLQWRYEENPLQQYEVFSDKGFYLAAYLKKHKYFNELRIAEYLFSADEDVKYRNNVLRDLSKKFGAQIISFGNISAEGGIMAYKGNIGPVLTFRKLDLGTNAENNFLDVNTWEYTLGDMELF